ncbi:hypothetical protein EB796_015596 [Bugula neritina]|uniref:INPP1 n=1 Tax=Bugula neritina TaxID=10212 RepID=A0A7J7JJW0_BUGNE|nr:hypothetical protein EB796_015596 [Bugula neritina]
MVSVKGFLEGLIIASEKASRITRIIRAAYWTGGSDSQPIHQRIATEEKVDRKDGSSDFKTLADVLCQTVIDYELRKLFPDIRDIHGEENCSFQSCGDEEVQVKLTGNTEDTKVMLSKALSDPLVVDNGISTHSTELENLSVDFSNIGVWIDPIDATKEYVNAKKSVVVDGLSHRGLGCCTVILGSYNLTTGQPFVGVVSYPSTCTLVIPETSPKQRQLFTGCYHPESSLSIVSENCIRAPSSARAGNKMLAVAKGKADLYYNLRV